MKKLLALSLLLVMGSCSLFDKTPESFEDYYVRNVEATIDTVDSTMKSLGFFRSFQSEGTLDAALSIPVILSGSFASAYTLKNDGRDISFDMQKALLQYDGISGSGLLALDELGLISQAGDIYVNYKNLKDIGFLTTDMREVFTRFEGKWLSWTQAEAQSDITDPTEIEAMKLAENISKLDRKQITKYLTVYPIWKSTADLGMSGALHMYSVELDSENVLSMMNAIRTDLLETGFTPDELTALREQLALIRLTGTLGFHTTDADITQSLISFGSAEEGTLGTLSMDTTPTAKKIIITDISGGTQMVLDMTEIDDKYTLDMIVSQGGTELAKATGYIDGKKDDFRELVLDVTAQGISATLKHTQKDDGKFEGRLTLPVGSISWNGSTTDKKLTALKVLGASPAGSFDLDLTPESDMVKGPFVLKMDGEEVVRAVISLVVEPERFRLGVDIPQGEEGTESIHAEIGQTTSFSLYSGDIKAPSSSTPLQEMIDALDALIPDESLDIPQGIELDSDVSDYTLDEMDSFDPLQ